MSLQKITSRAILATAFVLALGACAMEGQGGDDAAITAKVKDALAMDKAVPASQVHVTTAQGVVRMSGIVSSPVAEVQAVKDATQVSGVKSVDDRLTVHGNY